MALRRGIDGQFTFRGKGGTIRSVAFQRGIVQSASGGTIVVHATDGTTWTWDLVSSTVVRESGQKTTTSALATGEPVWVGGPVVSGAKDARLIVIRPPSGSSGSASPSPRPRPRPPAADHPPTPPPATGGGPAGSRRPSVGEPVIFRGFLGRGTLPLWL